MVINGKIAQTDHPVAFQIDHAYRFKLTTRVALN
jgi:hypothetical protein